MATSPLAFEIPDYKGGAYPCSICNSNPATLKSTGTHDGAGCLQCAFNLLAGLAQSGVHYGIKRMG